MRAGQLDRTVVIERPTITPDAYGTPVHSWTTVATVRAHRIEASTEEFIRAHGASSEAVVIFRIRYLEGITLADRVKDGATILDLKEIKELGRRNGLELRCVKVGA